MHLPLMALSALICLLLPVGAAVVVHRRLGPGYALAGWGALAFVLSQVVHIPLNLGVSYLFRAGLVPAPPAAVTAWLLPLALGLSAGLCEEPARYLAYRKLRAARSWDQGLMLGVGHGGIEAMLVGLSIAGTAMFLSFAQDQGVALLGVPEHQDALVQAQLDAVFDAHPAMMLLGALERALAMTCHVAMSLLVLQGVRTGRLRWLGASIAFHAVLNAGAVWLVQRGHPVGAEAFIAACALAAVAIAAALRPRQGSRPEPEDQAVAPVDVRRVPVERSADQAGRP